MHVQKLELQLSHSLGFPLDNVLHVHGALAAVSCTFCQPHLPKGLRDLQCFSDFHMKSGSRTSLVHLLPTSSFQRFLSAIEVPLVHILSTSCFKNGPGLSFSYGFETELSLRSRAHFVDLMFQKKRARRPSDFNSYY